MPIEVTVPGKGVLTFEDGTPESDISSTIAREFPRDGQDVASDLSQNPEFDKQMSVSDFKLYENYMRDRQVDFLSTAANAAGSLFDTIGKGIKGLFEARNLNPAVAAGTAAEAGAQGTRQLYGMLAQSEDPSSVLFRFKDWINGTGSAEDRLKQFQDARDFARRSQALDEGHDTVTGLPTEYVNNDVKNALSLVADPTLLIPGAGEVLGASKLAGKAVGAGVKAAAESARLVTRPLAGAIDAAAEAALKATGPNVAALKGAAIGGGATGLVMGVPLVREGAAAVGGIKLADKVAEIASRAGENLAEGGSRIGPMESLGLAPNAGRLDKTLAAIGRAGGDTALDIGLAGATGALEGSAIGAGLGYLSGGEEGAAAGAGSGAVLGGSAAAGMRAAGHMTGRVAAENRMADFNRFLENADESTRRNFEDISKRDGIDAAVNTMDVRNLLEGNLKDAKFTVLDDAAFKDRFGADARGVQIDTAGQPEVVINSSKMRSNYTAGHELFHALDAVEQLRPQTERIKQEIVGTFVAQPDGKVVQATSGLLSPEEVARRFDEYKAQAPKNSQWEKATTVADKARLVANELGAEYMGRLIAGSKPDEMLHGFSGPVRTLMDYALTRDADSRLRSIAEKIGLGAKPVESIVFKDLQAASPALNGMLRDLVRARRNLSERMVLSEDHGLVIQKKDINVPAVAEKALQMGVAQRNADGSVSLKPDDVLAKEDAAATAALRNVVATTQVADTTKPHLRMVDDKIFGSGISPEQLAAIKTAPGMADKLKEALGHFAASVNAQSTPGAGNVLFIEYGAATKRVKNRLTGTWTSKYSSGIRLSQREVAPYHLYVTEAGNVVAKAVDMSKLRTSATDLAARGRLGPYGGDINGFLSDSVRYFDNISDPNGVRTRELPGMTPEKATFLNQHFGQDEKGGAKFIRDFRLDRTTQIRPTGERIAASELAWQRQKVNWQPSEKLPEGDVISSNEGYRIISRKGKFSLYSPEGERIGIYDTQARAETVASAKVKSADSTLGLLILEGKTNAEGLPNKPKVAQIAQWFQDRFGKAIDYTKATDAEKAKLVDSLVAEIKHAYKLHPEAAGWYDENTHLAMSVMRELDPELAKPANDFIFKAILAVTSDGNLVEPQFQQTWKTYQQWKNSGQLVGDHVSGTRVKNIRGNIDAISAIVNKLGVDGAREWLTRKGTVGEVRKAAMRDLGMTKEEAMSIANGELVDEVVPYAVVFGPKLGSFFNNLYGDFSTTTMDRWFMRTVGRLTGTQVENISASRLSESRNRIRDEVTKLTKDEAKQLGVSKTSASGSGADEIAFKLGQYFQDKAARENLSPAANELRKAVNWHNKLLEPLVESPQNGAHRKWIRERIDEVQAKLRAAGIQLENADLQALLWYGEKELYEKLGYRTRSAAADYASAAAAIYAAEAGRPSRVYAEGSGRVGGIGRSKEPVVLGEANRPKETVGQAQFMPAEQDSNEYRGQHTAPGRDSAPAHDLTGNGVYPKDVYQRPDWYETDAGLHQLRRVLSWQGKPDHKVAVYRAIPKSVYKEAMAKLEKYGTPFFDQVIRPGDWVSISKEYVREHGESALNGDFKIVSRRVPVSDIFTNGDSIMEWGYHPKTSNVQFQPEAMPNGTVYREASGYSVVNKAGAKFRVYSPVGALLGVANSLADAERMIRKRL